MRFAPCFIHFCVESSIKPSEKSPKRMSDAAAVPAPAPVAPAATPSKPAKAPKTSKPKKAKAPAGHPAYNDMVSAAIAALKERNGSSRQKILKYIQSNYKVAEGFEVHVKMALKRQVQKGVLVQTKGTGVSGSFKVAKKTTEAKPAKKVAAKKPKAAEGEKKPAAKKATGEKKAKKAKPAAASKPKKETPKKKAPKKTAAKKADKPKKAAKKAAAKKPKASKPKAAPKKE